MRQILTQYGLSSRKQPTRLDILGVYLREVKLYYFKMCVILLFQMNKAGVLRKAIEVILKLQNDNARLKQENMALKMAQQKRGKSFL